MYAVNVRICIVISFCSADCNLVLSKVDMTLQQNLVKISVGKMICSLF